MCNYFSGEITEKGEVLWLKTGTNPTNPMNHESIKAKYNLKNVDEGKTFVPFEITFKDANKISRNREDAVFHWDLDTLPTWADAKSGELILKAWQAWDESVKIHVLLENEARQTLKDEEYLYVCLGKIEYVSDSAQIEYVSDSAQIESVSGSAQIEYVSGSAQIKYVYDSAQIEYVSDSAQIESVSGSAQIEYVYDSAQIKYVYDSAQIKYVSGSAQIKSVSDSAQIMELKNYATVMSQGIIYVAKDAKVSKKGKILKAKA